MKTALPPCKQSDLLAKVFFILPPSLEANIIYTLIGSNVLEKYFPEFFEKSILAISADIYIVKEDMKIIITLSQLKQILKFEKPKYPIIFEVSNFTDEELTEFSKLFQVKERG